MHRITRLTAPLLVAAAAVGSAVAPHAQAAPVEPGHVVINEVDTRGPVGGNDEFIELYNPGPVDVDLSDWALRRCNSSDTLLTSQINLTADPSGRFPGGTKIPAGGYLLVANTTTSGGYSRGALATPDFEYKTGITDHTGVQLVAPVRGTDGAVVTEIVHDAIGFSGTAATNACVEGVAAVNSGSNDDWTASRRNAPGNPAHPCLPQDTNVNATDVKLVRQTPKSCNNASVGAGGTSGVVLSEVDTSGLGTAGSTTYTAGNDEFIEIHNNTALPVDLTGWSLWRCNSSDTELVSEIVLSGSLGVVGAGATIYVHHSAWTAPAGAPVAAATYGIGVSDHTGVRLLNASHEVQDAIGFSGDATTNSCVETSAAANAPANTDLAATRLGAGTGVAVDTNVNSVNVTTAARTPGTF